MLDFLKVILIVFRGYKISDSYHNIYTRIIKTLFLE